MKKSIFIFTVLACVAPALLMAEIKVKAKATLANNKGWMKGGYGNINYSYTNKGDKPVKMILWSGDWTVDGKIIRKWDWKETQFTIKPGEKVNKTLTAWMPPDVAEAVVNKAPVNKGFSTLVCEGQTSRIPFTITIPVAKITDPMKLVKGKLVGLDLRTKNFEQKAHVGEIIGFLDKTYEDMLDLTGKAPYGAKLLVLKESPAHHAWAYAGNPIILSEIHVKGSIDEMEQGIVCNGWVHEMGHDFDTDYGPWYIWSGPVAEFQANFKLGYVLENQMTNGSFFVSNSWLKKQDGKRPSKLGRDFVDGYWMATGDRYLVAPDRTWDTLSSDETHSFFLRIVRRFGWDPIKKWYRTFEALDEKGFPRPATPAEKVQLTCAVLSNCTDTDLQPMFAQWKYPVTPEDIKNVSQKYKLKKMEISL